MLKQDLRRIYQEKRRALSPEAARQDSERIGNRLLEWLSAHPGIGMIHSFLPARSKNEIDTFEMLRRIRQDFPAVQIAVPRIEKGKRLLSHHLFTEKTRLAVNKWGIPEPGASEPVSTDDLDAVLVPMLIFDRNGHRVGYGGGFYDTFLADCPARTRKIGLCHFEPIEMITDAAPYDVRLDLCITPGNCHSFP